MYMYIYIIFIYIYLPYIPEGELDLKSTLATDNSLFTKRSGLERNNTQMPCQSTPQTIPPETDSASITEADVVVAYPPSEESNTRALRLRKPEASNTAVSNTLTFTDSRFVNSIVNIWPSGNTSSIDVSAFTHYVHYIMCYVHCTFMLNRCMYNTMYIHVSIL